MNISSLMPSPYSELHDGFLRKYLETGFASVLDMTRELLALSKTGYIFKIKLYVREIVNEKGDIILVGVISKVAENAEFIILDGKGYIFGISSNVLHTFKEKSLEGEASSSAFIQQLRRIHISHWIPDWQNKMEEGKLQFTIQQSSTTTLHVKIHDFKFMQSVGDKRLQGKHSIQGSAFSTIHEGIEKSDMDLIESPKLGAAKETLGEDLQNLSLKQSLKGETVSEVIFDVGQTLEERAQENMARNQFPEFETYVKNYSAEVSRLNIKSGLSILRRIKVFGILYFLWIVISNQIISSNIRDFEHHLDAFFHSVGFCLTKGQT